MIDVTCLADGWMKVNGSEEYALDAITGIQVDDERDEFRVSSGGGTTTYNLNSVVCEFGFCYPMEYFPFNCGAGTYTTRVIDSDENVVKTFDTYEGPVWCDLAIGTILFEEGGRYVFQVLNSANSEIVYQRSFWVDRDQKELAICIGSKTMRAVGMGSLRRMTCDGTNFTFEYSTGKPNKQIGVNQIRRFAIDEWEMVDLGLPSGTLWADRNLGASDVYDKGLYCKWGEDDFSSNGAYVYDGKNIGSDIKGTQYDIVARLYGDGYTLPDSTQVKELLDNCTFEKITETVDARTHEYFKVKSKIAGYTDKYIILPLNGWDGNGNGDGRSETMSSLWSSTIRTGVPERANILRANWNNTSQIDIRKMLRSTMTGARAVRAK